MTVMNFSDFPAVSGLNPWSAQIGSSTAVAPTINGGHQILYGICYDFMVPTTGNLSFWAKEITNITGGGVPLKGYQAAAILAAPVPGANGLPFPAIEQWLYQKQANAGWANYSFNLATFSGEAVTLFLGVDSPGPGSGASLEQLIAGVSIPILPNPNPHVVSEFPTTCCPIWMAFGPDGNIWFTEDDADVVARMTLSGVETDFITPTNGSFPTGITAGTDGNMWFTENGDGLVAPQIARISTSGAIAEFPSVVVPGGPEIPIDRGDGNIWYTTQAEGAGVGSLVFQNKTNATGGSIALAGRFPLGLAAGPDGNLYFVDRGGTVSRVSGAGGTVQTVQLAGGSAPTAIVLGPDGNMWFTETGASKIGRLTPASFTLTEFSTTAGVQPYGITAGTDGNVWFTESDGLINGPHIGRITPSGAVTEFPVPHVGFAIVTAPDGSLWFGETQATVPAIAKFVP